MSKIDEILNFLTNDLNITISNKKREQVINRFYPDINNKIYVWYTPSEPGLCKVKSVSRSMDSEILPEIQHLR